MTPFTQPTNLIKGLRALEQFILRQIALNRVYSYLALESKAVIL